MTEDALFSFRVGDIRCTIVNDGTFAYPDPGRLFFENAARDELAETLARQGIDLGTWDKYISSYPSLVLQTAEHLVLVDTGMGSRMPTTGRLLSNLRVAGFHPNDFDTVILTHAHPDHAGGNLDAEGNPIYPNARWVMWRKEWDFWTDSPDLSALRDDRYAGMMLDTARTSLPPIEPLLDLVEPGTEIVPGVTALAAPGHTPGQLALLVESGKDKLLAIADAIIHPVHVEHPEWVMPLDLLVDETVATRHELLNRAAEENMLVFAPHFDFPSLGRVLVADGGWRWQSAAPADS